MLLSCRYIKAVGGLTAAPPSTQGIVPPAFEDELDDELAPLEEWSEPGCAHWVGMVWSRGGQTAGV